jgi:hypothetical protein
MPELVGGDDVVDVLQPATAAATSRATAMRG